MSARDAFNAVIAFLLLGFAAAKCMWLESWWHYPILFACAWFGGVYTAKLLFDEPRRKSPWNPLIRKGKDS